MSVLYIVGTPIGNLGDITARALETFKAVDVVAAEDTRVTLGLLNHFGIKKPLVSCRARNEAVASEKIVRLLDEGRNVAYASDAGTPGLSDPGAVLVASARRAGHSVVPIPGVSAFATLLSVAGCGGKGVVFEGFLSPKAGRRRRRLAELMESGLAVILYESPYRTVKLLQDIADIDKGRYVVVGRELTKVFEEIVTGSADSVLRDFSSREGVKGEVAVFISSNKNIKNSEYPTDNNKEVDYDD